MARVNEGSHPTVLPATHTFIHKLNEPYMPLLPSLTASPVLTFRLAEGRRLSSSGRSVTLVSHAKTAEVIEMPLGLRTQVDPRNHVLGGSTSPLEGQFQGRGIPLQTKYRDTAVICEKNGGTNRDSVWVVARMGPKNCVRWGPDPPWEG